MGLKRVNTMGRKTSIIILVLGGLMFILFAAPSSRSKPLPFRPQIKKHSNRAPVTAQTTVQAIAPSPTAKPEAKPASFLTEEERQNIWNIEHSAYILRHKTFKPIVRQLEKGNLEVMAGLFHPDFSGSILAIPSLSKHAQFPFVRTGSASNGSTASIRVGRKEIMKFLERSFGLFGAKTDVKFVVKSLKPRSSEELTDLVIQLTVRGKDRNGRLLQFKSHQHLAVANVTEDYPSRQNWIFSWEVKSINLQSAEGHFFKNVTESTGLLMNDYHDNWTFVRKAGKEKIVLSGGVYLADYNRDGWLDVLLTDKGGGYLFKGNRTGNFEVDPGFSKIPGQALTASWADFDNDGWVDLLLGGRLFWNRKGTLTPSRHLTPWTGYESAELSVGDYDNDGLVDVYVLNSGPYAPALARGESVGFIDQELNALSANVLWKNLGNGKFKNVTEQANASGQYGKSYVAAWLQADEDLYPEIFIVSEFGRNVFLANNGDGTFTPRDIDPGWGGFSMGLSTGDIDNDGRTDLSISNMYSAAGNRILEHVNFDRYPEHIREDMKHLTNGNSLYRNLGKHKFEDLGSRLGLNQVGWGYSGNMIDANNDGFLDIYSPAGHHSVSHQAPDG